MKNFLPKHPRRGETNREPMHTPDLLTLFLQILEGQVELCFHLQQQQLIELIRAGSVEEALDFAATYLAPIGEENPVLLHELGGYCSPQSWSTSRFLHTSAPALFATRYAAWRCLALEQGNLAGIRRDRCPTMLLGGHFATTAAHPIPPLRPG